MSSGLITPPPFDIHLPSTPRHYKITPTMVDDFLIDPVMGVRVIFGIKLDAFQAFALKMQWWYPWFLDYSGLGTGKSIRLFLGPVLRNVLVEDQVGCVCYQTLDAGHRVFWQYFTQFDQREAPHFVYNLGKQDRVGEISGKDNTKGAACYVQHFKNGGRILMPAPNWFQDAKSIAGDTFNWVVLDEWTKIETMTKKGETIGGIDKQVLGRVRRKSWNQYNRVWCNRRLFSATAEAPSHPGYKRFAVFQKKINAGDSNYAMFTSSFKDFSNLPSKNGRPFKEVQPDWEMIKGNKATWTKAHFLREALGVWARETKGWYSEEALNRCVELGAANGLEPECTRNAALGDNVFYFMGVDSAPAQQDKSDDGALAVLRARPKPGLNAPPTQNLGDWLLEWVWAYRVRGNMKRIKRDEEQGALFASTLRHWSGLIHTKHRHFHLNGLQLDPGAGGGGSFLVPELANTRQLVAGQETEVMPIVSQTDPLVPGEFILRMFLRRDMGELWPILKGDDNLIHAAHTAYQQLIEHGGVHWPMPFNERPSSVTEAWEVEKKWALKTLDEMRRQLLGVVVETQDDGAWRYTQNGALRFSVPNGKKDLAYAGLMAFVRFLIWLKMGDMDEAGSGGEAGFVFG